MKLKLMKRQLRGISISLHAFNFFTFIYVKKSVFPDCCDCVGDSDRCNEVFFFWRLSVGDI